MNPRKSKIKLSHLIVGSALLIGAGVTYSLRPQEMPATNSAAAVATTENENIEQTTSLPEKPLCDSAPKKVTLEKLMKVDYIEPSRQLASVDESTTHLEIPKAANSLSAEAAKPPKAHRLDIWSGLGTNYLKFSQKDSSGIENGQFSSVTSPTFMVETRFVWSENWSYVFSYNQMPGKIQTKNTLSMDKDTFTWSYFSLEAERHAYDGPWGSRFYVLGGVQRHQMPFLVGGTTYDVDLIQTQLTTASLGARLEWQPMDKWLVESFMRYQIPLASEASNGGDFKTTGGFSFDGLLGISRALTPNWKLGLFWFGQSHNLNYSYTSTDKTVQREGTQTLFNSDLQVRFGYQWNFGKD